MEKIEFMATLPLFKGLPDDHMRAVADIAVDTRLARGRSIFAEGDEADGFYVVFEGQVKIFKVSPEGREQIIHIYGPGETFAEVPVFEGGRFPASAETTAASRLLYFSREGLLRLIERDAGVALNMLAIMAAKLRRFTVKLENLTLREMPQRLAAYLLDLSERSASASELELDIAKGHLASLLGTAQETLSRVLRRMSDAGIIAVDGRRIVLVRIERLEALASGEERL
ncbi:CRP/FNR family transcriptional regulator [Desulfobaculum xiamenense]|uniref:CRP/FNR family transcriptional regulator n=1 Tax=Desulfobaculum xiamenense TaxID=995050 RepID=A0A846QKN2_9BACT|nr:Crp/Fnr family transcriptional regulator [Desulfobaculum xiamenense]NJB67717.1 CRP/FNR family transcriptional regulator [Desulfobaculum xiamenense]